MVVKAAEQLPLDFLQKAECQTDTLKGKYFDIKRDIAMERTGGVFCHACLTGRTDHSPDPRYCQRCYDFLAVEAQLLQVTRPGANPGWLPQGSRTAEKGHTQAVARGHNSAPTVSMAPGKPLIMSTSKRGPKNRVFPWELITKLAGEGLAPKTIAARLYAQQGVKISYKTIERKLQKAHEVKA